MIEPATFRRVRVTAFLGAALLLAAVGVAMIVGIRRLGEDVGWVEHTYQVLQVLEEHESGVRTAESAARGFRLTGNVGLLSEYRLAAPATLRAADNLVALTADNPPQQSRAQRLRELSQGRLAELERLVKIQLAQGAERARQASIAGTGLAQMTALEDQADELRLTERALLADRRMKARGSEIWLTVLVALGIALPLLVLAVLVLNVLRENRRFLALERDAQSSLRETEVLLAQRNRLAEQHRSLGRYAGLLQSSQNLEEAMGMTANVIVELLPESGGRCYVLRASQNLAESAARFGTEAVPSSELLPPDQCWALRRGQPHRYGARGSSMRCTHFLDEPSSAAEAWTHCVPLMAQGTNLGLLHVNGHGEQVEADHAVIEAIGEQLSLAMVNLQLRETLRVQSLRDPLTELYNRRYLEESLLREIQRCQRRQLPVSVLMLDVDHFKQFNDTHGHGAGDALLRRIGQALTESTRGEDIACRYGGEEFTVLLPEASSENAARRADDIRRTIGRLTVQHLRRVLGPVTCSIGVATCADHQASPSSLMEAADAALYRAKALGRNRVEIAGSND